MNRKIITRDGVLFPAGRLITPKRQNPTGNLGLLRRLANEISPNICIYRSLGGIGDVLMSTPAIRAIKHEWPGATVTYATDFKYSDGALREILKHNSYIDNIIPYQVAAKNPYDVMVDITAVCVKTEKAGGKVPNRIDLFADAIGVSLENTGYLPIYEVTDEEKKWANQKIKTFRKKTKRPAYIGVQVRASTQRRMWPLGKMRQLVSLLANNPAIQVVVFDSTHGAGEREEWNIHGVERLINYGIPQVAAMLDNMDLVIVPDSGLMHLAGALNKKMVTIFGSTDPNARINHYPNAVAVRKSLACSPCWYQSCKNSYACLSSITVEQVFNAVMELLPRPPKRAVLGGNVKHTRSACSSIELKRRKGGLGDVISMTCAVSGLRKGNAGKNIHVTVPAKYLSVFENNPYVTPHADQAPKDIIDFSYDLTDIDAKTETQELMHGGKHLTPRQEIYIRHTGGVITEETVVPKLYVTEDEEKWIRKRFMRKRSLKYIAIALDTAEAYRMWPPDKYDTLFRLAKQKYPTWRFLLLSDKRYEENLRSNLIDVTGFGIRRMFAAVSCSDVVVTPDTSVLHVAAGLKKPCVALFGPISDVSRCKNYPLTTVVKHQTDCMPCWRNSDIPCKKRKEGSIYSYCMERIQPTVVLNAIKGILDG